MKGIKKIIVILCNRGFFNWLNDKDYLKLKFYCLLNKKLDLKKPTTFNEKIQWLKVNDRNNLYIKLVDKFEVKEYVASKIGNEYIIPTIGVFEKFEDIDFSKLPNRFVIKCTHDSGGIVICKDKDKLNIEKARKKINKSLKRNYYFSGREWPYKGVKPRIIIEEYMEDKKSYELIDYKVMCFNGSAKIIFTCTDRYSDGLKVTFFDRKWNKLPFERKFPMSNKDINKPINLELMIELSEKLSKEIPFVRMDWYEINGRLYFGEFTFYPGSGFEEFSPDEWDEKIGKLIDIV